VIRPAGWPAALAQVIRRYLSRLPGGLTRLRHRVTLQADRFASRFAEVLGTGKSRGGRCMSRQRRIKALLCVGAGCLMMTVAAVPVGGAANASTVSTGAGSITQYGNVVFVPDGDTIDVKIDDVPADSGREGTRIRFLATQATEIYEYHHDLSESTGECHAVEAAKRLKELLFTTEGYGRRVRLTARDASSNNLGRVSRFVATQAADGVWHDVGSVLVREGQVIPSYQKVEYTYNKRYRQLSQEAAAQGIGLWDTNFCGSGPAAKLSVRVMWDADGNDSVNVNGEYVKITNNGTATVNLAGWWVRDSATRKLATKQQTRRGFIFPSGAKVAPGSSVYVHVGQKPATAAARHFYYGLSAPIFENATSSPVYLGDGAYLFDPQGDLRGWHQYPCVSTKTYGCRR
jgi:micrococcal nuclease